MIRKMFEGLYRHTEKKPYSILVGARQTGKSTLIRQLRTKLQKEGRDTFFLDLEQKDVRMELNADPLNLLRYFSKKDSKKYVFIDEIQYLDDPSNFLKLIYDEFAETIKIIATGSSAFYIDKKFNDSLAGRKRVFYLDTCSFEEYLEMKEENELLSEYRRLLQDREAKSAKLSGMEAALEDYIIYGGYPAVVCENDRAEKILLLKELRDAYLQRDIEEAGVQNQDAFYRLYTLLAAQTGSQVNVSELSATLRISKETVENYLYILQKCFHIALLKPFYRNIKKELVKMPKAYIMDTGMRNCLINYFPEKLGVGDDGALFEDFIYHSLRESYSRDEIRFWRTADQKEVDFVIDSPDEKAAYEVKYNTAGIKPGKYKMFKESYPDYKLRFISKEPFSEERIREMAAFRKE